MGKRVILTLIEGSFEQGFPVVLRICEDGPLGNTELQVPGKLPPEPAILESFNNWQLAYRQMVMPYSRIKPYPGQVTNVSCGQLGSALAERLNRWLNSGSSDWQKIRDRLQRNLSETDEIQVLIETEDTRLQQLPWHLWDLFAEHYQNAEIAISTPLYQPPPPKPAPLTNRIKILAILGDSTGIDVQQDRAVLEQLPNADTTFLVEPQRQQLNDQLWAQSWDILFFAGHSATQADGGAGQISINQSSSLSINELKNALRRAIEQGLQLAIFNSCDGLGLARELADLYLPQIIVMREPVPDVVAQEFLKHFLITFAQGKSLYLAVREARERLQGLEDQFPCATWLPVICQNPAAESPTWKELWGGVKPNSTPGNASSNGSGSGFIGDVTQRPAEAAVRFATGRRNRLVSSWRSLRTVFLASAIITTMIVGVRQLGVLQPLELQAFDQLLRLRPEEKPDPRLLVITIPEADIQSQKQRQGSLSDPTLAQLLQKLDQYQPQVIGLDIHRDFPVGPNQADLATRLKQSDRLIAVCKVSASEVNDPGIPSPPEISPERLGFSDAIADEDTIARRHLLGLTPPPTSACSTRYAFSLQLALYYLNQEGIQAQVTPEGQLQLGSVVLKRLTPFHTGSYQKVDTRGYQVLLNYRHSPSLQDVATQVTLGDVLSDRIAPDTVKALKGRIILIGVTAPSTGDFWSTPYSSGQSSFQKQIPGVFLQAQMVSQILSAVLDQRPLLWVWPQWGEALWIWGWSMVGGLLAWRFQSLLRLGLAEGAALGILSGLCFGLIIQGGWVPLVPSTLALIATGGGVAAYTRSRSQADTEHLTLEQSPRGNR